MVHVSSSAYFKVYFLRKLSNKTQVELTHQCSRTSRFKETELQIVECKNLKLLTIDLDPARLHENYGCLHPLKHLNFLYFVQHKVFKLITFASPFSLFFMFPCCSYAIKERKGVVPR